MFDRSKAAAVVEEEAWAVVTSQEITVAPTIRVTVERIRIRPRPPRSVLNT
jgi:hypothetical protein